MVRSASLVAIVALAACAATNASPHAGEAFAPAVRAAAGPSPGNYIKHVVVIVQENRSFNTLFYGFPGAVTQAYGYMHDGKRIALHHVALGQAIAQNHNYSDGRAAFNGGKMNGFDLETYGSYHSQPAGTAPYAIVDRQDVAPYWDMAHQYVLADRMFTTMMGPSFTAHLDLIAGTTSLSPTRSVIDAPSGTGSWGCDASPGSTTPVVDVQGQISTGPFPCYTQFRTLADTLDAAGVSWKYYAAPTDDLGGKLWTDFDAIRSVRYGPDWRRNVITPETTVLGDPGKDALASVSWVIPDWENSDHSWSGSGTGPSWVGSVVNAIGESPDWKSTAIFIVWDDWGGFFDPMPPPQKDYRGLGMRVGCIVVSPYAKHGYVDHEQYEFGSILRFIEATFELPPLGATSAGYTDSRGALPLDAFDFAAPPRAFTPIPVKYPPSYFLHEKPSYRPDDDE